MRDILDPAVAVLETTLLDDSDTAFASGSTAPLALALLEAIGRGATRVVICARHTRVHDGGRGFAEVLAERWGSLPAAREALSAIDMVVAGSDPAPLVGLRGAGAILASEVGAGVAQERERQVAAFAAGVERELAPAGRRVRWSAAPWSGSAGGAAFVLLALGGRAMAAEEYSAVVTDLGGAVRRSDLCVTVVPELNATTLARSALAALAPRALQAAVPIVVLSGEDHTSRPHRAELGVAGSYTCRLEDPSLRETARRVARTWSTG